jgi:23S rRNA pseudouridine955/2504/2580 synthase
LITNLKGVPKSHIYQVLRTGQVRVNKGRQRPHYRVQTGDILRIPPLRTATATPPATKTSSPWLENVVLYEDPDLLILNKPSGLAVHGGSGVRLGLIESLRQQRPKARYLELAHRLDRDTSGCLIIAKRRSVLRTIHAQLREGAIAKHYTALLVGVWKKQHVQVQTRLKKNRLQSGERVVRVQPDGKLASSRFTTRRVLTLPAPLPDATLVDIELLTGRTHQARVHAAHNGCPIAGDTKYGDRDINHQLRSLGLKRLFLHAGRLVFQHPVSGATITAEAPLPIELAGFLVALTA